MDELAAVSEKLESGDKVRIDQTITLRVHHAMKRPRGKFASQCSGGCGAYLIAEEKSSHHCPGPPAHIVKPSAPGKAVPLTTFLSRKAARTDWRTKKIVRGRNFRKAMRKAMAKGQMREFLDNC